MVSIAIIGFGGMGSYHYKRLKRNKLLNVVGVYDISKNACQNAKNKGLRVYDSFEDVLNDKAIDGVLIATPNEVHCDYTVKAANAKKHVLCEKPVTLSSQDFKIMTDAATKNNVNFTVNQNRRQDRDFKKICKVLSENKLGRVYKIESNVMSSHGIPGGWRKIKEQGGGMIYDWGVHLVDQALTMIDAKVVSVYCKTSYVFKHEVDDGCRIMLTFDNGMEINLYIDTNSFLPLPRWLVYGENGSAVIKNWACFGKMVVVKERNDKKNKGIRAGNGFTKTMADRSKSTTYRLRLPKSSHDSDFIYRNFKNAIENKEELVVNHQSLSRVLRVMEACFMSEKDNQVIKVDI